MIGYTVIKNNDIEFRSLHQALVPLNLPHVNLPLNDEKAATLLKESGYWLVRWDECFDQSTESCGWWHVIKDGREELSDYSGNTRSKVRRGLKRNICEIVDRKVILEEGYHVYKAANERYDTFEEVLTEADFNSAITSLPKETEFWAVRDVNTNKLVAFSENLVRDNACFYVSIWFSPESLRNYSSYVLFHEMNAYYLNTRGLDYVSDGARSVSHDTSIHDFLQEKFGFRKAYAKLRVVYRSWLKLGVILLFPFKSVIAKVSLGVAKKVSALLELESIRRKSLSG